MQLAGLNGLAQWLTGADDVRLAFANGTLREMELSDSLGQVTTLEFSELVKNPKLDNDLFRFVPPAGVDIIGE